MRNPRQQRGVALLSVLLITALVTVIVSHMLARQRLSLHSSANLVQHQQLWQLALSGESWARQQILAQARRENGLQVVHPGQPWAAPAPVMDIEGGRIHIELEDLGARLNLNSLRRPNDLLANARYQRLLALLGVRAHDPALLSSRPGRNGKPLPISDISELRQLPQVDAAALEKLRPMLTAGPASALNINTASAVVLASLEGLDLATASNLVKTRPEAGYPSVQVFLDNPMLAGRDIKARGLTVGSQQFRATIDVELDGRRLRLVSDLHSIDGKTLRVEQRHLPPNPAKADRPNE